MSDSLISRFRIMVVEIHYLDRLWEPLFFNFASAVFEKILQTHVCVHIHPNNSMGIRSLYGINIPKVAEFTFIRKDRVKLEDYQSQFPHRLDFDNRPEDKHISLPKSWYRSS